MTPEEKKRLQELVAKKVKEKLSDSEFAEYKELKQKSAHNRNGNRRGGGKRDIKFDPGNDFSWWSKIPELIKDCASFKSNYIAGTMIDPVRVPVVVPGVLEIKLSTCYSAGSKATDAVNVWARNLYLKMFQKYRPASSYSASDLGITELASLEAVKLIALYERIYGVINRYSVLNVNMPLTEAQALGLSTSQVTYLQGHMSDFRYDLNYLIRKAQRLCIPKDISLIADAISLFGYEYIDHNNPRGQIILFTLDNYGVYSDTDMSTGGEIHFSNDLETDLFNFNAGNMCTALDTVLSALLGSDSVQRIYADLTVWFGGDAMLQFLPMPEDYVVVPTESKSILHKMHNIEQCPSPINEGSGLPVNKLLTSWAVNGLAASDEAHVLNGNYHVYQFNDNIITVGAIKDTNTGTPVSCSFDGRPGKVLEGTTSVYGMGTSHIIDGYEVDVNPEFITEATLFKYVAIPVTSSDFKASVITSNVAYIVFGMTLHDTLGTEQAIHGWSRQANSQAGLVALVDWAPLCYSVTQAGSDTIITAVRGDLDVIVPISAGDLTRIHRTCFLSGLSSDVPVKS